MASQILPASRYPVLRIPVFSGGASGEVFGLEHDPGYNRDYFSPFAVATQADTKGQGRLEREGKRVYVHPWEEGMTMSEWTDGLVDLIGEHLPPHYTMDEVLILLTGCDLIVKGKKVEEAIGPRKMNIHPAPLYILTGPGGQILDAWNMEPEQVAEYMKAGYRRRYVGWGEEIMPKILQERHIGASTAHIASPEVDHGPAIAIREMEKNPWDTPQSFQERLKEKGDGPAIVAATHMIIRGLEIEGYPDNPALIREGETLPYQGLVLEDGWEEDLGIEPMRA